MKTETAFRAATLWFIVVIYFNMDSSGLGPPFVDFVEFVGLLLFFLLPVYLLIETGRTLVREHPEVVQGKDPR
ncbi:hypothetical protein C477_16100 [Haloterrigena salina JCM 13891]|uniref:Uncharacterized protein n=1 Tax=Haloterrigena salina JCM 13891 TaxID=1227488 RepID=M0BZ25_9EURY|nr:hypothetical protein [Haloterrigena salina]ELZ16200.1 hypothetical protein C477_16100 [Haloterrigena salina JCM 13891]